MKESKIQYTNKSEIIIVVTDQQKSVAIEKLLLTKIEIFCGETLATFVVAYFGIPTGSGW